ncbi:dTDP-4-dehydrorhamnose 3,5-epimerase [Iodidimonas gelatinilytica]|uniref:dTDP-4-dehydrorhamnose 3,5-epimerase n=1 Tax=Iodidimonas gelatinilytica TaxID=1236966 RepID=A0A5A7MV96_9PROT|nr:dTDP-4-dehydrorhamnose 3,5-epimerase [Iodidimonas gelatinilytica]GEQ98983.1 dTDP-4-dehydrorhamnose 3,5-epimerase [Iodidimonas gelatinilytica]GEQ99756.1 dTDP-4-dehydrorhamnose 3,5-epimerase [Iodidimonas gelatinilytica]
MKILPTALPDVKIIEPKVFGDDRGFFMETWNARRFGELGLPDKFVQDNHSRSTGPVLRGLHYQIGKPQGKLVRCIAGAILDVAVDLRRHSADFGRWVGVELSADNHRQLWVPQGFAHGFLVLGDSAEVFYKCTDFYAPECERSVIWNDPEIAIDWPLNGRQPLLSAKDAKAPCLADAEVYP